MLVSYVMTVRAFLFHLHIVVSCFFVRIRKCFDKYKGDYKAKKFIGRDQFMVMSYVQFTRGSSLRVVKVTLTAFSSIIRD